MTTTHSTRIFGLPAGLSRIFLGVLVASASSWGCGSDDADDSPSTGGSTSPSAGTAGLGNGGSNGGSIGTGGTSASGGPSSGGTAASGGSAANGGSAGQGAGGSSAGGSGGASSGGSGSASGGLSGSAGSGGTSGTGGGGGGNGGSAGAFTGPSYPYIFANFNDAAATSSLMIYTSNDALNFTLLLDTKYTGPTGFMRDPSIMRHTDGKYYVAFTTPPTLSCCGDESSFAIGTSANLRDWTTVAVVPSGLAGVKNTWAPEWFVDSDGSVHVIAHLDLRAYRYEPTDATLTKWTTGKPIGINTLDTQILKIGDTYHAIVPNRHLTAPSLDGPWKNETSLPACKEAPAVVHISGDTWRFYCDDGGSGHEKSSLSMDLFKTWSPLQTLPNVGINISHGTVIRGDTGHPF